MRVTPNTIVRPAEMMNSEEALAKLVELHDEGRSRTGTVVEFDRTETIFTNPTDERTEAYVTGRSG